MTTKHTVSVNMCCYNGDKYLREALDSVVNQTYTDWELVIINDGSTDSTESVIREYIDKGYPIVYHYQENHGLGYSRNEALKRSSGEFIAFIDQDDMWLPEKLTKQVNFLESNQDIDFLYSNFIMMEQNNNKKYLAYKRLQPSGFVFERFLYRYSVGILTVLIRKKVFNTIGELFDRNLDLAEEYDIFMRILRDAKAFYMVEPLAIYRIHKNMLSLRFKEKYPVEINYVLEKLIKLGIILKNGVSFK